MMKLTFLTAAIVTALAGSSAVAKTTYVKDVGGWMMFQTDSDDGDRDYFGCSLGASYKSEEMLLVIYYPKIKRITMSFEEKDATSVNEGKKKKLGVVIKKGKNYDDGWCEKEFVAAVKEDGTRSFSSTFKSDEFLPDFSGSSYIYMLFNEKPFTGFSLEGTSVAVNELKKCAFEHASVNPNDPFL